MSGEVGFFDSNLIKKRKVKYDETSNSLAIYDGSGNLLMPLESHAYRHVYGGPDALPDGSIGYTQLMPNTIQINVPVLIPDSQHSGLSADSTGVKWTSSFKFKVSKKHLKNVVIRATWTASASDSVSEIDVVDAGSGNVVASVSGNAGVDVESNNFDISSLSDDGLVYVQAQTTTASSTSGATFDIKYVVVEIWFGIS